MDPLFNALRDAYTPTQLTICPTGASVCVCQVTVSPTSAGLASEAVFDGLAAALEVRHR
jgi:hypothetical protein